MQGQQPRPANRIPRRAVLAALGTAPLVATGALAHPVTPDAATAACTLPPAPPPRSLRPGGAFDQLVRQLAAQDQFSGTVLLAYRDRPALARAFGMANKELSIPNRLDTIFALASLTKSFTAMAVVQLAQHGKVTLSQTLGTYLDGFPADIAGTVTVHQLLTHTSGMGDFVKDPDFLKEQSTWTSAAQTMDGIMAIIRRSPLLFTPGTRFSYSNSGYVALGAIVAQVSGQSYYDYVREHVFAAAGMSRTDFYTTPQWRTDGDIAHPYATQPSGQRIDALADDRFGFIGNPAGNAFSTAEDMVRFAHALWTGTLLNRAYTELTASAKVPAQATVAVGPPPPAEQAVFYCYGLGETILNNQRIVWHNGGGPGESTNLDTYPDLDWVAVRLSNYDTKTPIDEQERQLITTQAA